MSRTCQNVISGLLRCAITMMVVITVMKIEEDSCDGSLVSRFAFVLYVDSKRSALDHQNTPFMIRLRRPLC